MADCPYGYNGTAWVTKTPDGPRWDQADPRIHVADELRDNDFLLAKYEIVEACEFSGVPAHHARRRDDDG